jgi:hypothetical protein
VLGPEQFTPTTPEATRARGGFVPPPLAVTGRNRLELHLGTWRAAGFSEQGSFVLVGAETFDLAAGLQYNRFLREDLALTFGARVLASTSTIDSHGVSFSGTFSIVSLPLGVRWNPMKGVLHTRAVKPYLAVSLGPIIGSSSGSGVGAGEAFSESRTRATFGGIVGAGVAFHVGRHFSLGVEAGYQWMADFAYYIGARDNYSGFQLGLNIGWLFGKGSPPLERGGSAAKAEQAR